MEETVAALQAQHEELAQVLDGVDDAGWQAPSRCDGWTVSDVVLHLAQTNEMAIASLEGTFADTIAELAEGLPPVSSIDEGVELMVTRQRGASPADVYERYTTSAAAMRGAFLSSDPHQRVTWVAGQLAARTLATTRLAELWIHTGDVLHAFGREPEPSDRLQEIARLAWRTLPYAFARVGRELTAPVAFRLTGPHGDAWDFGDDAPTVVRGSAAELCMVASRRVRAQETALVARGPDGDAVLDLVRTWA